METYLTIEELASHLKLAVQTIRRYVLNREIPYHKIKKVIRFRLSEIEWWVGHQNEFAAGGLNENPGSLFEEVPLEEADTDRGLDDNYCGDES
jgi:excisionase family DNA binding protein